MIKLEVTENIEYHGLVIHRGTLINIAPGATLITCDGLVTGLPEGASPILNMEDLQSDEFKNKYKILRNKTAVVAKAKVLFRKARGKLGLDK